MVRVDPYLATIQRQVVVVNIGKAKGHTKLGKLVNKYLTPCWALPQFPRFSWFYEDCMWESYKRNDVLRLNAVE